jgi:hypothetical protein
MSLYETRERDLLAASWLNPGCFSLTGIDAVPLGNSRRSMGRAQASAWTHSVEGRSSVRQEVALIGPVERQIEFGKMRRSELEAARSVSPSIIFQFG